MQPNQELLHQVRVGFIKQRSSLNAFCTSTKEDYANARKALLGEWEGDKARELRTKIIEAAGIEFKELEVDKASQLDLLSATKECDK